MFCLLGAYSKAGIDECMRPTPLIFSKTCTKIQRAQARTLARKQTRTHAPTHECTHARAHTYTHIRIRCMRRGAGNYGGIRCLRENPRETSSPARSRQGVQGTRPKSCFCMEGIPSIHRTHIRTYTHRHGTRPKSCFCMEGIIYVCKMCMYIIFMSMCIRICVSLCVSLSVTVARCVHV